MRRIILTAVAVIAASLSVAAQDVNQATEIYNSGAAALSNGDKTAAMDYFQQALSMAATLGKDGEEIAANCKSIIPELMLSIAKDMIKAGEYDNAVSKLQEVTKVAKEFGDEDNAAEATDLIPQVFMQQGGSLLNGKNYAGAAEAYKKVLAINPANGVASLRLGMALAQAGNIDEAVEAYKAAKDNGQEKAALKQLSNLFLKKAASSLKAKDFAGALAAATESNSYLENAQAFQVAGQAAQLLKKNDEAVANFEKYLELKPTAKNAGQIAFTVAALYQQSGNKAKAVEFYKKASTDPTYGAEAAKLAASLQK